jgi:transcriptional regulator with XRE-family HTH domain
MPKPREKWQADVQAKLSLLGMTQAELGRRLGTTGGVISQAMCGNYSGNLKKKILKYLNIKEE